MKSTSFFRNLLLIIVCISSTTFAQECDEKIREKAKDLGALGYQRRTPQARCEGLYYDNVAGVSLDLVSLTAGRIRYRLNKDEVINIRALPGMISAQSWIRGTSFRSRPKYRLDMALDKKKNIQLPVRDVLNESRLPSTDIGFFGYFLKGNTTIYFPVATTSTFYKSPESAKVYITVLSNVEISTVLYKIAENANGVCGTFSPETKLNTPYEKMEPIEIEVGQGRSNKQLCIEISVLPSGTNTSWISKQFNVSIP